MSKTLTKKNNNIGLITTKPHIAVICHTLYTQSHTNLRFELSIIIAIFCAKKWIHSNKLRPQLLDAQG